MSNEAKDYLRDVEEYRKELFADYQAQNLPSGIFTYTFEDYLICRMYHESLPSKEPA